MRLDLQKSWAGLGREKHGFFLPIVSKPSSSLRSLTDPIFFMATPPIYYVPVFQDYFRAMSFIKCRNFSLLSLLGISDGCA